MTLRLYQGRGKPGTDSEFPTKGAGNSCQSPVCGLLIQSLSMRKSIFVLAIAAAATVSAAALDQKDVEYARPDGKSVLLDLHVPDGRGPFPAAILIHGGGFDEGSKSTNVRQLFDVLAGARYGGVRLP